MEQKNKHLLILIGIGVAVVIFLVIAFSQKPTPQPGAGAPAGTGPVENVLPKELRTFSGRITDVTGSSIVVEWSIPKTTLVNGPVTVSPKHITWTKDTVFQQTKLGVRGSAKAIAPADLKVGQAVAVTVTEAPQDHYELLARQIQVVLPLTLTP